MLTRRGGRTALLLGGLFTLAGAGLLTGCQGGDTGTRPMGFSRDGDMAAGGGGGVTTSGARQANPNAPNATGSTVGAVDYRSDPSRGPQTRPDGGAGRNIGRSGMGSDGGRSGTSTGGGSAPTGGTTAGGGNPGL